jgi:hypothetical protein
VPRPWEAVPAKGNVPAESTESQEKESAARRQAYAAPVKTEKSNTAGSQLRQLLKTPGATGKRTLIRQGVLMAEILAKPVGLRD